MVKQRRDCLAPKHSHGAGSNFQIKNTRRELWILTIAGSFKNMKTMMEAKIAIVTSAGKRPAAPGIFCTVKD
jgi:hypothetical protein